MSDEREQIEQFIAEGYRRFPDEVEPIPEHPAGKITVDRGSLRYAFLEGAIYAATRPKIIEESTNIPDSMWETASPS